MKLYPKLNVQQIRNSLYIGVSIIVLTIIIISPNIPLDVFAQKNINLKILKIHFEAIQFNYDHDSTRGKKRRNFFNCFSKRTKNSVDRGTRYFTRRKNIF